MIRVIGIPMLTITVSRNASGWSVTITLALKLL
ncbi:hypothetical protein QO012_001063 [Methylobacterium aerolatum]|uniref:Uncharacterized protein n=1 Tax=Methylobacterium aerolatum TaxID=418708 RepID=A0ABU0HW60_9HYPH|nr:hypothetical protein [Methylobacterium aerolatum]